MKRWWFLLTLLVLFTGPLGFARGGGGGGGDGDPFPTACVDFTGSWKSDSGSVYSISQHRCSRIQIKAAVAGPSQDVSTQTIVPDNRLRSISSDSWTGMVRHRWNDQVDASELLTYRTMNYRDHSVNEVVILEIVNESLLLESTYRTVDTGNGNPQETYSQQVFRKASDPGDCYQH